MAQIGPLQFWQLAEMADGVREQAWAHTAKLAWAMLSPYSKHSLTPDQLNDYLQTKKAARLEEMAATMPDSDLGEHPTNEEIDAAWQRFKEWQRQAQVQ